MGEQSWAPRWRVWLACGLVATVLGCQLAPSTQRVRGVILAVEPQSVARAGAVTVRTVDGRELRFVVAAEVPWTPGHLREHMASGEAVLVEYRTQGDDLLALRIDDG